MAGSGGKRPVRRAETRRGAAGRGDQRRQARLLGVAPKVDTETGRATAGHVTLAGPGRDDEITLCSCSSALRPHRGGGRLAIAGRANQQLMTGEVNHRSLRRFSSVPICGRATTVIVGLLATGQRLPVVDAGRESGR